MALSCWMTSRPSRASSAGENTSSTLLPMSGRGLAGHTGAAARLRASEIRPMRPGYRTNRADTKTSWDKKRGNGSQD